jgi:hypothetical protein
MLKFSYAVFQFLRWLNAGVHRSRASHRPVVRATKFCTLVPNICGPSAWNLLFVAIVAPRILRLSYVFGIFLAAVV